MFDGAGLTESTLQCRRLEGGPCASSVPAGLGSRPRGNRVCGRPEMVTRQPSPGGAHCEHLSGPTLTLLLLPSVHSTLDTVGCCSLIGLRSILVHHLHLSFFGSLRAPASAGGLEAQWPGTLVSLRLSADVLPAADCTDICQPTSRVWWRRCILLRCCNPTRGKEACHCAAVLWLHCQAQAAHVA